MSSTANQDKNKRKIILNLILGLVLVGVILMVLLVNLQLRPVESGPTKSVRFVVNKGQSVAAIAQNLKEDGLIRNELIFRLLVKQEGLGKSIQAGSFQLAADMKPIEIARALTEATNDLWLTIPEGWRREQITQKLAEEEELTAFDEQEFLELTEGYEGRLFPDTYLVARDSTAETIFSLLRNTFQQKVISGLAAEIEASSHDFDQALILASIVEREARGRDEMRHVSGILWNRLNIGMALQTDATLQYIKGYDSETESWWPRPTSIDKNLESAFNTYLYPGLPPHPIANPGLTAIEASLDPQKTENLYYLHDAQGEIHYARSLEAHNANVRQYLR